MPGKQILKPKHTPEMVAKITAIARDRIEKAMSWEQCAKVHGYKSGNSITACVMSAQYLGLWHEKITAARQEFNDPLESEAILTQRQLMRPFREITMPNGDKVTQMIPPQVNQSAAHSVMNHCRSQRAHQVTIDATVSGKIEVSGLTLAAQMNAYLVTLGIIDDPDNKEEG